MEKIQAIKIENTDKELVNSEHLFQCPICRQLFDTEDVNDAAAITN